MGGGVPKIMAGDYAIIIFFLSSFIKMLRFKYNQIYQKFLTSIKAI